MNHSTFVSLLSYSIFAVAPVLAENWPNLRGPNFDGSSTAKGLPVNFSKTEGVAWVADMPGPAASTPIVWGDHVFVSAAVEAEEKLYGICLSRKDGAELWRKPLGDGFRWDDRSNLASPTAVTDGKLVVFYFGTGDIAAFDFTGKEVWKKNLQKEYGRFATQWTYSSSPMLDEGRVYIQVLQRNESFEFNGMQKGERDKPNDSYILALDLKTGNPLWKVTRPSKAKAESLESFSTPVVYHGKRSELLITGGDCITGHDPKTGKELWRWDTWNPERIGHWRLVPCAAAGAEVVLACAPKGAPVYAYHLGRNGDQGNDSIAWTTDEDDRRDISSDVSTPLFYQGHFYILNSDKKTLACVDPKSGKPVWNGRLEQGEYRPAKFESSPTGADGKIYMIDHRGTVVVAKAGGTALEILAINPMGNESDQFVRSSIAVAEGQLFIRTTDKLYCVGKK